MWSRLVAKVWRPEYLETYPAIVLMRCGVTFRLSGLKNGDNLM